MAPQFLGHLVVRVRPLADGEEASLTEETVAASDGEGNYHAVSGPQVGYLTAHLNHFAHELMPQDVALLHGRYVTVVQMQVGAADRGQGYLHHRVSRVLDAGVGYLFHPDVVLAVPSVRFHRVLPLRR